MRPDQLLMYIGALLLVAGTLWSVAGRLWPGLGHLPGDIEIARPNVRIYFPLATCLAVSIILSAILCFWSRLSH
jgi:hypothetical protein